MKDIDIKILVNFTAEAFRELITAFQDSINLGETDYSFTEYKLLVKLTFKFLEPGNHLDLFEMELTIPDIKLIGEVLASRAFNLQKLTNDDPDIGESKQITYQLIKLIKDWNNENLTETTGT